MIVLIVSHIKNIDIYFTGWERTVHMLCIMDKSLSVFMTLRMCLRDLCCLFLNIYVFIMAVCGDGKTLFSWL